MRIAIIGCGYVGLTTAVAMAHIGHLVQCIDDDPSRVNLLQGGGVPIHEAGLTELLGDLNGRVSFGGWDTFNDNNDVVFIAVGTPGKTNGDADLSHVEAVALQLGSRIRETTVIVNKSTAPIGSARRIESVIKGCKGYALTGTPVMVASCPEFLREGLALYDVFYPDRVIVGAFQEKTANILKELYAPILQQTFNPPAFLPRPEDYTAPAFITTTPFSAELIKYASNSFLAMKISYINEIAGLAERVGADIREVARGIGLDRRIGLHYLNAGLGWGGSCFGKDLQAIIHTGEQYDHKMLLCRATVQVNINKREEVIKKLLSVLKVIRGRTIGILGLSFKPDTDDLRDAASLVIVDRLLELGAHVRVYDPVAMPGFSARKSQTEVFCASDPFSLASGCDALVLATEWKEFINLPFNRLGELMNQRVIIDGRNVLDREILHKAGFTYIGMGC